MTIERENTHRNALTRAGARVLADAAKVNAKCTFKARVQAQKRGGFAK